jgi:hypothetical protein
MLPICYQELAERMEFDIEWFDFENTMKQTIETNKEKKYLHLKNLVLNKRKRSSTWNATNNNNVRLCKN